MITTLTFTPGPPLSREALTYTTAYGYTQAAHLTSKLRRPIYRFTLRLGPLTQTQMASLSALHAYYQGSLPFYWDGGEYGRVENYNLFGEGDSLARTFYLPNRFIGASSFNVRTVRSGVASNWSSGFSLSPDIGLVTFANSTNTIPRSGDEVQAIYGCLYRVNFAPDGLKFQEIASNVYQAEVTLIENVLVG